MESHPLPKLNHLSGQRVALFGCGDIGSRLAKQLVASGALVKAYRRDIAGLEALSAEAVDFSQPKTLQAIKDEVFDFAVITLVPERSFDDRAKAYQAGYVGNLQNILQVLNSKPLKKVLWVSSTSVYAQSGGQWVDETSEADPQTATGKILRQAEDVINSLADKATVVRFSGIYRSETHRYLNKLLAGDLPEKADQNFIMNRIHVDDCAGILGFLMDQQAGKKHVERLVIGTDSQPVDYESFVRWLSLQLHQPLNTATVTKAPPSNKKISNQRLRDEGYAFLYPTYREGFARLLQIYQERGQ